MKPERSVPGWHRLEPEVQHYFEHEEGVAAMNMEPKASNGDPRPPQFPAGSNYYTMMTAIERLKEADTIMRFEPAKYVRGETEIGKPGAHPVQQCVRLAKPSCSMVLRGAYGNRGHQFEDMAPGGEELLARARRAYVEASKRVPARKHDPEKARRGLEQRLDRMFREGELVK